MGALHLELMRDPARAFPPVTDPESLRSARIWHCKYASLARLGELRNLEALVIAGLPDASLDFVGGLEKLRFLKIVHLPKISDISALSGLRQLTSLSLATLPGWDASGKTTTIASLEPLAALPELAHLELFGICAPDKSLAALEQCKRLRTARIAQYPQAEVHRFFASTDVIDQFNPEPSPAEFPVFRDNIDPR